MLLLLAIVWAVIAGIGVKDIQAKILQGGGVQYASAVIIIVFGAWFAQILIQTGIAESVIRSAVELAGDRPLVTAIVINLVTALLFTSMYGVGAAIAIGVIALPIMLSQGIPARVAAPDVHHGASARARIVNLVQFGTFEKLFPGIKYEAPWLTFWMIGMVVYLLCAWTDDLSQPAQARRAQDGERRRSAARADAAQAHALLHLPRADIPGADDHGVQVADHSDLSAEHRAGAGADLEETAAFKAISICSTRRSTMPFPTSPPSPRCGPSAA